jgi:hypothetical protein
MPFAPPFISISLILPLRSDMAIDLIPTREAIVLGLCNDSYNILSDISIYPKSAILDLIYIKIGPAARPITPRVAHGRGRFLI